jgi:hypothetical protein
MYVFEAVNGERVEEFFHMEDAPSFGTAIRRGGRKFYRIPTRPNATVREGAFVNYTMARGDLERMGHKRFNEHGEGVFSSKREMDELISKSQDTATPVVNVR